MRNTGFTLIEIMIGILIVSIIILGGFSALSAVTVGKVRLIEKTNIEKQASYFSQKLFEMIKSGGTLDYEEYWNRKIVDNTSFSGGHFAQSTGFGNFGESGLVGNVTNATDYGTHLYYCLSGSGSLMGNDGCVTGYNTNTSSGVVQITNSYIGSPQRYSQYALQFINFNINADRDFNPNIGTSGSNLPGDEDSDGSIIGDDDDEYLGEGPEVFTSGSGTTELYLISGNKKQRTLFRWNVISDPNRPTGSSCNPINGGRNFTGSGCLGTIEFLQLEGKDWGSNHDISNNPNNGTLYDGAIDTWLIAPKFHTGSAHIIAGSNSNNYWQNLFPDTIHVSDFEIYAYPNKDRALAWKEDQNSVNIAPYIRMTLKLQPSWKQRKLIKGTVPELDLSTTISLTDLYSQ